MPDIQSSLNPTMPLPNSQVSVAGAANQQPELTNTVVDGGGRIVAGARLDDLIPDVLKQAADKMKVGQKATQDPVVAPSAQRPTTPDVAVQSNKAEATDVDDDVATDVDGTSDDNLEFDLSDENIDKLVNGETDAVVKSVKADNEDNDTPFWHASPKYKALVERASYAGFKAEDLDALIREAADTKTLTNNELVTGLTTDKQLLERKLSSTGAELERLRRVERAAAFDLLPETQEKYGQPMAKAVQEMKKILDLEGSGVSVHTLLNAKDRTELVGLFKDAYLEDVDLRALTNYWRQYKDLEFGYNQDKRAAQNDMSTAINAKLAPETVKTVLQNSLSDFIEADPKYGYIKEAIFNGIEKHEDVSNIVATARDGFQRLLGAMQNPSEFLRNEEFLSGLAKFMFEAAHNKHIEAKYKGTLDTVANHETKLKKVVAAYRKLAASAKGLNATRPQPVVIKDGNVVTKADAKAAEEFKSFLSGKLDITDIL